MRRRGGPSPVSAQPLEQVYSPQQLQTSDLVEGVVDVGRPGEDPMKRLLVVAIIAAGFVAAAPWPLLSAPSAVARSTTSWVSSW